MKFFIILTIVIINSYLLTGCKDSPQEVQAGSINGRVFDYKTMGAIKGVIISTEPPTSDGITNDTGYFYIDNLNQGTYKLNLMKYGYYPISEEVYVYSGKATKRIILMYDSVSMNNTPEKPILIAPNDGLTTSSTEILLNWSCSDPDGDVLYYDVYFDTSITVSRVIFPGINVTKARVKDLKPGQTYYWKIAASDKWGASSQSDVYAITIDSGYVPIDDNYTVCYFPFNGNSNNKANVNILMTKMQITYKEDRHNNKNSSAYFNGESYISVNNDPQLQLTDGFSVLVWLKPETGFGIPFKETGYVYLASMWYATGIYTSSWGLMIHVPTKQLEGSTYDGANITTCTTDKLKEGVWTHVAFTYNEGVSKLYINGELVKSAPAAAPQQTPYSLEIGRQMKNICMYKGGMDDLIITRRALSDLEIRNIAKK